MMFERIHLSDSTWQFDFFVLIIYQHTINLKLFSMKKLLLFCTVLLQTQFISFGQCDIRLRPADNPSTAYRARGERCEGAYVANVGGPSLEIAGFTIGVFSYKLEANEVIQIKNPTNSTIFIRSSALPLSTYYRMDATIAPGKTLRWEVNEVLNGLQIQSNYLGVYGWSGTEGEKTYLPVKPVSSGTNGSDRSLYLIIRTRVKAQEAKFRYALTGQNFGNYENLNSPSGNRPLVVVLPENLNGRYTIEVAAKLESEWIIGQYKFLVR